MIVDAEKGGYTLSMRAGERDPRITKVGHFIRATRIDELPQLLNILKGGNVIIATTKKSCDFSKSFCYSA